MGLKIYKLPHPTDPFYISIERFFLLLTGVDFSDSGFSGRFVGAICAGRSHLVLVLKYSRNFHCSGRILSERLHQRSCRAILGIDNIQS